MMTWSHRKVVQNFFRLFLSLESLLHFLKSKNINNCYKNTKLCSIGPRENNYINFKVQKNCAITGKISSSVSIHQHFQWAWFHMNFNLVFEDIQNSCTDICDMVSKFLGTEFFPLVNRKTFGGFLLKCLWF